MKKADFRKQIYLYVEKLLDRELTVEEHGSLRDLIKQYGKSETEFANIDIQIMQKQGQRIAELKKALYALTTKRGLPESVVARLDQALSKIV